MDILKLQNGSDIRGVAEGGGANIDEAVTIKIARAFTDFLKDRASSPRVLIGRDSRLSGERLLSAFAKGVADEGGVPFDAGLSSTPAMFMSTVTEPFLFDGAVMITASHLPADRNGFKFFTASGGFEKNEIRLLLESAEPKNGDAPEFTPKRCDFMSVYAAGLVEKIRSETGSDTPLAGKRIIVDAGNGAGGFFATDVLKPLGADTTGSLYLEPDGSFPNHAPNPEDDSAMHCLRSAVLANNALLGIIFDTDVDRAGAVLQSGEELNRNRLIALIAAIVLKKYPRSTIVTDSITSTGLAEFIASRGGVHHRFKRGYRNVINEAVRLNTLGQETFLAMETSGHGALRDNYFLDDGAYLMVLLLIEIGRGTSFDELLYGLREAAETREFRLPVRCEGYRQYGEDLLARLAGYVETLDGFSTECINFEGVRANADSSHGDGWFLMRMSLHEPLMPLNIESSSRENGRQIARALLPFLKSCRLLDTTALDEYAT